MSIIGSGRAGMHGHGEGRHGLRCFKRTPRMALGETDTKKRMERVKILVNVMKHNPNDVVILFLTRHSSP